MGAVWVGGVMGVWGNGCWRLSVGLGFSVGQRVGFAKWHSSVVFAYWCVRFGCGRILHRHV